MKISKISIYFIYYFYKMVFASILRTNKHFNNFALFINLNREYILFYLMSIYLDLRIKHFSQQSRIANRYFLIFN
jgi:hypothetical protein